MSLTFLVLPGTIARSYEGWLFERILPLRSKIIPRSDLTSWILILLLSDFCLRSSPLITCRYHILTTRSERQIEISHRRTSNFLLNMLESYLLNLLRLS